MPQEMSVALALAVLPTVELLGGKTGFSKLDGAGGRRWPLRKANKIVMDYFLIFGFLRVFYVNWGRIVLHL
jgi:hypothetical protein